MLLINPLGLRITQTVKPKNEQNNLIIVADNVRSVIQLTRERVEVY